MITDNDLKWLEKNSKNSPYPFARTFTFEHCWIKGEYPFSANTSVLYGVRGAVERGYHIFDIESFVKRNYDKTVQQALARTDGANDALPENMRLLFFTENPKGLRKALRSIGAKDRAKYVIEVLDSKMSVIRQNSDTGAETARISVGDAMNPLLDSRIEIADRQQRINALMGFETGVFVWAGLAGENKSLCFVLTSDNLMQSNPDRFVLIMGNYANIKDFAMMFEDLYVWTVLDSLKLNYRFHGEQAYYQHLAKSWIPAHWNGRDEPSVAAEAIKARYHAWHISRIIQLLERNPLVLCDQVEKRISIDGKDWQPVTPASYQRVHSILSNCGFQSFGIGEEFVMIGLGKHQYEECRYFAYEIDPEKDACSPWWI